MTAAAPAASLAARLAQAGDDADWRDQARAALGEHREVLTEAFAAGEAVERLIGRRCALIDTLVTMAWQRCLGEADAIVLLATGGYGRGELYPFSDVDLLVLAEPRVQKKHEPSLARFFALLWDAGLATSHASHSKAKKRASDGSCFFCTRGSASTSRSTSENGYSSPRP